MPQMNVRQLEVFRAVMHYGGVNAAAKLLHVSQPAVSQSISNLEATCGFKLFDRSQGGMIPTTEAEILIVEVDRVFGGVDRVKRIVEAVRDLRWGSVSIAAFPAMAARFLPAVVSRYCSDHPDVAIRIEGRRSRSLIDWVAAHQVDIGIGLLPAMEPGVASRKLAAVPGVCVIPVNHTLAQKRVIHAQDLAGEPFVSLGREDRSRFGVDKLFDDLGIVRNIRIEAEQSETACSFVACGAGVTVVDPFCIYKYDDREFVVRPFEPRVDFAVWLLTAADQEPHRLAGDLIEYLRSAILALAESGPSPRSAG